MFIIDFSEPQPLALSGLDADLDETEVALQSTVHDFAERVMRPIAQRLDRLSAEQVIAADSPFWEFWDRYQELDISLDILVDLPNEQAARIVPIVTEELAWGDAGLALAPLVMKFPEVAAKLSGDPELIERFTGLRGCWLGTQPDRGSDGLDGFGVILHPGTRQNRGNLLATVEGDDIVINGQSSAWVSCSPVAECALATIPADYGDGVYRQNGTLNSISLLIPFDLPGVSKGKPLAKIGQRALPQGEVFFDNVRVPKKFALTFGPENTPTTKGGSGAGGLVYANMYMGLVFTGLARAAYEHALAYVHERRQGGVPLIQHQSVKLQIFDLWQQTEMARALSRRAAHYNFLGKTPSLLASITSKTGVTKLAFQVASDALQLFGGNGLTNEYPMEKLLRDARSSLIEDGENNVLNMLGAGILSADFMARNAGSVQAPQQQLGE